MTPSFDPIISWPALVAGSLAVVALTLWAYRKRLRGTAGRWRWVALGLRLAAVALCLLAALKPSLLVMSKRRTQAVVALVLDASASMGIADEANGRTRYEQARSDLEAARDQLKPQAPKGLEVDAVRFAESVADDPPGDTAPPDGRATALGDALAEVQDREKGKRLVAVVLLADGASNAGRSPILAAQKLKGNQVPVIAVGYGSESAGASSRDVAVRDLVAGPTVFVKNELRVRGTLAVRGYPNVPLEVELLVEDDPKPVATTKVTAKEGAATIPIADLSWTPQKPGETKLTLRVKEQEGELVATNNQVETYVTVQKGGLSVLFLAGPGSVWEPRFLTWALDASPEIQVRTVSLRRPVAEDPTILPDEELRRDAYDVFVLNLPAEYLTRRQQELLVLAVRRGAGLMMLGGRFSFGAGGWARTPLAEVLPTNIHPGDQQIEPEGGLPFVPNPSGLNSFILRMADSPVENKQLWAALPPLPGAHQLGSAKPGASVLALAGANEPLMVTQEVPEGRALAFGSETWPWYRDFLHPTSQVLHRKFWRQAILWLAHKEDQGESQVRLALDRRRVAVGQKLDLTVTARDERNEPITDLQLETEVAAIGDDGKAEPLRLFNQGTEYRGSFIPLGEPGEYRVTVRGRRDGQEVGGDTARFIVFRENHELDNPAADLALLRQIAEITGGKLLAPEQLPRFLQTIDADSLTESVVQKEVRLWDNWPFLLAFAALLTAEWWLRKRHGWV